MKHVYEVIGGVCSQMTFVSHAMAFSLDHVMVLAAQYGLPSIRSQATYGTLHDYEQAQIQPH